MRSALRHPENLIVIEILLAIALSIAFIIVAFNLEGFWGADYLTGLLRFYGGMSAIFFASVLTVGIIGAIHSKQSGRIVKAILYAVGFWLVSLIVTAVSAELLRLFSAYFMLAGISYGFNYGLTQNVASQSEDNLEQ